MLLKDKIAVIYGAGGGVGCAVAYAFARGGANLFLTGRLRSNTIPGHALTAFAATFAASPRKVPARICHPSRS
jgi:NAD(P)-dependent dehydrogenase (short-subunit alcohol dehydrogenase family)